MTEDQKPLSPSAAAAHLGVSPRQVRYLLETGALAGFRVGKLWKTELQHVVAYKKKNGNQSSSSVVDLKRAAP